jgi:hypothetical protein
MLEGNMDNIQTTAEFIEENNTATDEDKKFFEEMDYHSTYGKTFGAETIWSIYNDDEYGEIKFGNPHPFGDNAVIRHKCDVFGPYNELVEIKGKTWGDVWVAANKAIVQSDDLHHIYIEGFKQGPAGELRLITGS